MSYDLYSKFDIEQHKAHYVNYLEVIIKEDGTVEYAVPSHQRKLENILAEQWNTDISNIRNRCPQEMYWDYIQWLCLMTGCVSLWSRSSTLPKMLTRPQLDMIHKLIYEGLYVDRDDGEEIEL